MWENWIEKLQIASHAGALCRVRCCWTAKGTHCPYCLHNGHLMGRCYMYDEPCCLLPGFPKTRNSRADRGFPRGNANLLFSQIFLKTAWKWKKIEPVGSIQNLCRSTTACIEYWKDKIEYLHISTACPTVTRYPSTIHINNPDFIALVHEKFQTYPLLFEFLHPYFDFKPVTWTSMAMFNLPGKFNTVMIFAFGFLVSGFLYPISNNEEWSLSFELSYITLLLRASRFVFHIIKASYMKNVQYLSYTRNNKVVYSYNWCKQKLLAKTLVHKWALVQLSPVEQTLVSPKSSNSWKSTVVTSYSLS